MGLKLGLNLGYWGIGPQGDEATEIVLAAAHRLGPLHSSVKHHLANA